MTGPLLGDQVTPVLAINGSGGLLVWSDSFTDGDGSGIRARRLDGSYSGLFAPFRVNEQGVGDQSKPAAALLSNGGSVIVWQGSPSGLPEIHARFLTVSNTWASGDVRVNTYTNDQQVDAVVAALDSGDAVVAWASYNQASATSMKDVYFQRLSSTGDLLGGEVRVNQSTSLNQRSPSVARLSDGRFVLAWVNEARHLLGGVNEYYSVDIYARIFSASGVAHTGEFIVNTTSNVCANPSVAASGDGGFLVSWMQKDLSTIDNSWDIVARPFSGSAVGGDEQFLNTLRYGDQIRPKVASTANAYFAVWTSLRQDGSHEGVFGRFLAGNGTPEGDEFQVNTTAVSKQIHPSVASDGAQRFLSVWSSFVGLAQGFDLYGQRYATESEPLPVPEAPYVWALSSSELKSSWTELAGFEVATYEVYVDEAVIPAETGTNNWWIMSGLEAGSTHTVRLAYSLTDGRRSPLSETAGGTTFSSITFGGIPYDWGEPFWDSDVFLWPSPYEDSDGDGASNYSEFLAGTDPTKSASVLMTRLETTPQGYYLHWNTVPGRIYQIQQAPDFTTWSDLGGPRFAAGSEDSIYVGGGDGGAFRVILLRY